MIFLRVGGSRLEPNNMGMRVGFPGLVLVPLRWTALGLGARPPLDHVFWSTVEYGSQK